MGRKRWYPQRWVVELLAHRLALHIFPDYGDDVRPAGAISSPRLIDEQLLESALGLIRQPFYRTTLDKAGALLRSMIKNHPFVDGNKRLGVATTFIFLALNGYMITATNQEVVSFALSLAQSDPPMSWREVSSWLRAHCVRLRAASQPCLQGLQELQGASPDHQHWQELWTALQEALQELDDLADA